MIAERVALARVVVEKHFRLLTRYFVDTAAGVVLTYVMFLMVFFGGASVAPETIDNSLAGIIIGFFVWTMSFGAFQDPSQSLIEEAKWGTLEQLYMSPLPFGEILTYRTAFSVLVNVVTGVVVLLLMMLTTGKWLAFDLVSIVPIVVLTLCTAVGLGFALGGVALVYKRVSNVFLIVQFLFVGALAAPSEPWVYNLLPLALGYDLLRTVMSEGVAVWNLPTTDLLVLTAVAVAYIVGGFAIFTKMVGVARRRGILGDY